LVVAVLAIAATRHPTISHHAASASPIRSLSSVTLSVCSSPHIRLCFLFRDLLRLCQNLVEIDLHQHVGLIRRIAILNESLFNVIENTHRDGASRLNRVWIFIALSRCHFAHLLPHKISI
jgi:hypothetical protein